MMSVIETQIWEEIPEKKGYVRYVGQRKLVEVFNELEAYLKKEGDLSGGVFPADARCAAGYLVPEGRYSLLCTVGRIRRYLHRA